MERQHRIPSVAVPSYEGIELSLAGVATSYLGTNNYFRVQYKVRGTYTIIVHFHLFYRVPLPY